MKADEGFKLEMMQAVSLQSKNRQAVERSQSVTLYLGDVVVTQLQHLDRQTDRQLGNQTHRHTGKFVYTHRVISTRVHAPLVQVTYPGSPAAPQSVGCCEGRAVSAWKGP